MFDDTNVCVMITIQDLLSETLDTLQEWVTDIFSAIPDK